MTRNVEGSGDRRIDGLLIGIAWADAAVTYSDPQWGGDYGLLYPADVNGNGSPANLDGFEPLSETQRVVVQAALDVDHAGAIPALAGFAVEGFTGLGLDYAGANGFGTLRFGNTGDTVGSATVAYAYSPGNSPHAGDVWLGEWGRLPEVGNRDLSTVLHETGHALGLKHPHEAGEFGTVPRAYDSPEFTVMSYRSFVGHPPSANETIEPWGWPQSFMMLDIAALQHMYGADFEVNDGDTVYAWRPGAGDTRVNGEVALPAGANRVFTTIWDGGGRDAYDLSAYRGGVDVDLRPGRHSVLSERQLADLGGGPNGGHARGNVFNALLYQDDPRSLIEDALGGRGDDRLRGNAAHNRLEGGAGDDRLIGGGRGDALIGGGGADVLRGGGGWDLLRGGWGPDLLRGGGGKDRLIGGRLDDTLIGGPRGDSFVFRDVGHSPPGAADRIVGDDGGAAAFGGAGRGWGDVFDLRRIDGDATAPGHQSLVLATEKALGHLWLNQRRGDTALRAETDGDGRTDFVVWIEDGEVGPDDYGAADFLL